MDTTHRRFLTRLVLDHNLSETDIAFMKDVSQVFDGGKSPQCLVSPLDGGKLAYAEKILIQAGKKIAAIKSLREREKGMSLSEAKFAVDSYAMLLPQTGTLSNTETY